MPVNVYSTQTRHPFVAASYNSKAPCYTSYEVAGMAYGLKNVYSRTRESRARPPNLLTAMTGREWAQRYVAVPGLFKREFYYNNTINCSGVLYPLFGYTQYSSENVLDVPTPATPPWQNSARDVIQNECINLAADLAQYRETGNMFLDMAKEAGNIYKDAKRLKFGKFLSPKRWSKIYLGYKFGIAPLVQSTAEAVVKLGNNVSSPGYRIKHVTAGDVDERYVSGPYGGERRTRQEHTVQATIVYTVTPQRQLVDGGTPLEWAWELIPFSFVVDWGIQVGDWLTRLDALKGVSASWGTVSHRVKSVAYSTYIESQGYSCVQPVRREYNAHWREVFSGIPAPQLTYKPSVTLERVKTAMALLGSAKGLR